MKLLRRFNDGNKNLGFEAQSTTEIPGVCDLVLLPGRMSLLAANDEDDAVALHRIGLGDGQASFPVAANIRLGGRPECTFVWNKLLVTMSPCPLLICFRGDGLGIPLSVPYLPDQNAPVHHPPFGLSRSTTTDTR